LRFDPDSVAPSAVRVRAACAPARPFQPFDGCIYKPQRWNDGDSFHVILPDRKEVIFRLYFVDTPEVNRVYANRIAEQAAYFGITPDAFIQIGRDASEFTKQALTSRSRSTHAVGVHSARSAIGRYFNSSAQTNDIAAKINKTGVNTGCVRLIPTPTNFEAI
jgi:hypothetical protein